jgi:hypothetical protein
MKSKRPTHFNRLPDVEKRQVRLAENSAAMDRWLARLIRAARQLDELRKERKRLLNPRKRDDKKADLNWTPDKYVGSGGGSVDNGPDDDLPDTL